MKALTLTSALTLVLHALACGGVQQPATTPTPQPTPERLILDKASPETVAFLKSLLYSDEPLEKVLANVRQEGGLNEDPWRSFGQVFARAVGRCYLLIKLSVAAEMSL